MTIDYKTIGAKIQYFRTLRGVSQENLAEAAAVSRVSISNLERGETGTTLETLVSIANALRITTDDILADILIEQKPSDLCAHFDIFAYTGHGRSCPPPKRCRSSFPHLCNASRTG